ncbi:MAG: hypothetical protein ACI3ZP_10175 [Candidatus Cryptobacteroides sp.]
MKTYTKKTTRLKALPRSKRARYGSTGASSSITTSPAAVAIQGDVSGHTHSNLPELEKFSTDSDGYGYLSRVVENSDGSVTRQTDKMKSGYADDSGNWDGHAFDDYIDQPVRKADIPEFAGLIAGLLKSSGFTSGTLGSGFMLGSDGDGNAVLEVDKVIVRKAMEVAELIIQQLSHQGGISIYTPASIECTSVEEISSGYKCSFDNHSNTVPNLFKQGDQARCQRFDLGSTSAKYYWRLVTEVGSNYIVLSKSDCDSGSGTPEAGDRIIQMGNRSDKARQKAAVMDVIGTDAPRLEFYDGIDSYDLSGKLITVIGVVDGKVGVYTDAGRFNNIEIGAGSSGLENLAEWAGKQNEIDSAKSEAESAGQKADNAQATADSATKGAEQAQADADSAKSAAEKAQADADAAKLAAANAQFSADAAQAEADNAALAAATAQNGADEAKSRLDNMASDSIISPVEKTALVQQKADIMSEYTQIVSDCERYGVSYANLAEVYDSAIKALDKYTADMTADSVKEADYNDIADYYDIRQLVLESISAAAKQVADDAQAEADKARKELDDINSDTVLTPVEKRSLMDILNGISERRVGYSTYSPKYFSITSIETVENADRLEWNNGEWLYISNIDVFVKITFEILDSGDTHIRFRANYDEQGDGDYVIVSKPDDATFLTATQAERLANANGYGGGGGAEEYYIDITGLSAGTHYIILQAHSTTSAYELGCYFSIAEDDWNIRGSLWDWYRRCLALDGTDSDYYQITYADPAQNKAAEIFALCYVANVNVLDTTTTISDTFRTSLDKLLQEYNGLLTKLIAGTSDDDVEYLKEVFKKGKTEMSGGVVMSEAVAVRNANGEVDGMLNGSDTFEDGTHGKAIVISGIPSESSSGSTSLVDRATEAETIVYEDGTIKTRKLQAESGMFSGELYASSGKIGGFDIEPARLYGNSESELSQKSMTLGPGQCFYSSKSTGTSSGTVDIKSALGVSVLPAVSGIDKVGIGCAVSVSQNVVGDTVIAGYFSASGKTQDDAAVEYGSHALYLENGTVAGFRPVTRVVTTSKTLSKMDSVVVVKNTSTITLSLPSSPQKGQTYLLLHTTSTTLNITGSSTYQINRVSNSSIATTQNSTNKEGILLVFDGTYWQLMYL